MTRNETYNVDGAAREYKKASTALEEAARYLSFAAAFAEQALGSDWVAGTTERRPTLTTHAKASQKAAEQATTMPTTVT